MGNDNDNELTDNDVAALTAPALQQRLVNGDLTAERVTRAFLARIDRLDKRGPAVNAIIEVNPDALRIARDLDRSFAERGPTGPLHGIPVVLKANIDTADQQLIGVENVVFGSDYPHPEGMYDPVTFVDELEGLPPADQASIMGGNLARIMKLA